MSEPFLPQNLKHRLTTWTDADVATYYVAVALGIAPDSGSEGHFLGTFIHPKIDDEVEDWGNRARLLAAYRALKKEIG